MPMSTLFFWKFRLSIRTCNKELIWSTNYPYVHIIAFRKHWSFIWGCFFPVSILETYSAAIISSDFNTNVSCPMRAALLFCMHIKTARNKAQLFKKTTWVVKLLIADLPVSAMIWKLGFQCFVGIYLRAFNVFSG